MGVGMVTASILGWVGEVVRFFLLRIGRRGLRDVGWDVGCLDWEILELLEFVRGDGLGCKVLSCCPWAFMLGLVFHERSKVVSQV